MEEDFQKSLQLGLPVDNADAKYVSGLSTILVATIQEAKDRISQIEYIFCSQLYPNFQSQSKTLLKIYSEARKATEYAWKEKEKDLLLQIGKLQFENQQALEANQSLKSDTFINKLQEELEQKTTEVAEGRQFLLHLLEILGSKSSEVSINEKLVQEQEDNEEIHCRKEMDKKTELQNRLLQLVLSKASLIVHQEKQLKKYEVDFAELLARERTLKEKLSQRTLQVDEANELEKHLRGQIEDYLDHIRLRKEIFQKQEQKIGTLENRNYFQEDNVDRLEKELRKKFEEVEEGRKLQEQLLHQADINAADILKKGQELRVLQQEKNLLLTKLSGLEENVAKLQMDLRERSDESVEGMELHGKLLQQIELKDSQLLSEKKKRKDVISAYKRLKSQYNFLCAKFGLTTENMLLQNSVEEESVSLKHDQHDLTPTGTGEKVSDASAVACDTTKQEDEREHVEDVKMVTSIRRSCSESPTTSAQGVAERCPGAVTSCPPAGTKRPISYWRDTKSHQDRGSDPHDDFLDTPLENIRGYLKKSTREEVHNFLDPDPKDLSFDSSDDETQDMNSDPGAQKKQMPPPRAGTRGFKYVEPVRRKADRENLKGIECKQCKKFYDAVLPDGGGKDTNGNKQNLRCEHHDGVSRHRYRYAPPLTPEGFWNIGFESEM